MSYILFLPFSKCRDYAAVPDALYGERYVLVVDALTAYRYIADLLDAARAVAGFNPLKTGVRRFISELHVSRDSAGFLARRVQQIAEEKSRDHLGKFMAALGRLTGKSGDLNDLLTNAGDKTPALDLLVLSKFVKA